MRARCRPSPSGSRRARPARSGRGRRCPSPPPRRNRAGSRSGRVRPTWIDVWKTRKTKPDAGDHDREPGEPAPPGRGEVPVGEQRGRRRSRARREHEPVQRVLKPRDPGGERQRTEVRAPEHVVRDHAANRAEDRDAEEDPADRVPWLPRGEERPDDRESDRQDDVDEVGVSAPCGSPSGSRSGERPSSARPAARRPRAARRGGRAVARCRSRPSVSLILPGRSPGERVQTCRLRRALARIAIPTGRSSVAW